MAESWDRRTFLSWTGAAAGASLVGCAGAPRRQHVPLDRNKRAVKLGMVGGTFASKPLVDRLKLLVRLGFDGVELDSPNAFATPEVLDAKAAAGIEIPGVVDSVHWQHCLNDPAPEVRKKGIDALETALRDAKAYGASSVLLVPGRVDKRRSYEDCYRLSQQCIREVLPLAAELEVQVAIENVWNNFLLSPVECARYIDEFDSPWIGVHFDVGNVVKFGWPEHWIRTLGPRIIKLDVKEFSRERNTFGVELLEGDCDWPEVMRALHEVRYRGWFTAELRAGDEVFLAATARRMKRILALGPQ